MESNAELRRDDRASARSGATIFTIAGSLWTAYGVHAAAAGTIWLGAGAAVLGLGLLAACVFPRETPVAPDPSAAARQEREGKAFGIVNAVQGVAIFVAAQVCHNLRVEAYFPAVFGGIVGLHFLALEPVFRARFHGALGALMCLFCLGVTLFAPKAIWGVSVGFGNGALLWLAATARLVSARAFPAIGKGNLSGLSKL